MNPPTLQRIGCVLYTVPKSAFEDAKRHYEEVLGLERLWERPDQAGFAMDGHEEGIAELVLSTQEELPQGMVHYLVDSVAESVEYFGQNGYEVVHGPEEIPVGNVATVRNEWGHEFDVMDFES
ncbi:VOC family protein [Haladaptatus sp. CMAA 1911]|uniref:VOC family protein n=1 Tax=unclassified Haladaptatus TaxID=2622732 RepID=UPI003753E935